MLDGLSHHEANVRDKSPYSSTPPSEISAAERDAIAGSTTPDEGAAGAAEKDGGDDALAAADEAVGGGGGEATASVSSA